jgi:hypothetical protein
VSAAVNRQNHIPRAENIGYFEKTEFYWSRR